MANTAKSASNDECSFNLWCHALAPTSNAAVPASANRRSIEGAMPGSLRLSSHIFYPSGVPGFPEDFSMISGFETDRERSG